MWHPSNAPTICLIPYSSSNSSIFSPISSFVKGNVMKQSFRSKTACSNLIVVAEYYANVRFQAWTVAGLFSFWRANVAIRADANTCLHFPFTTLSHKAGSYWRSKQTLSTAGAQVHLRTCMFSYCDKRSHLEFKVCLKQSGLSIKLRGKISRA